MKKMLKIDYQSFAQKYLGKRDRNSHKGDYGHVLIIGGQAGFSGAPLLAALGALRSGAGLVSIATHIAHASFLNVCHPEIMVHGIKTPDQLSMLLEKATVIAMGPGLGTGSFGEEIWQAVLKTDLPLVLDADGLNLLAKNVIRREDWILTPHPGEAATLLNEETRTVQSDRLQAALTIQKHYGGICVLKGSGTLVVNSLDEVYECTYGNPGMASGGMGDALTGVIAAYVAQHIPLMASALLGVTVHALAADRAAKGGERGMIATDLLPYIRELSNS